MARIEPREYNSGQLNNIEKINGDYFLKVLIGNSNGDFINNENPLSITKVQLKKEIDTTDGSIIYTGLLLQFSTIAASTSYITGIFLVIMMVWIVSVRLLGKQFSVLTDQTEPEKLKPAEAK